MVYDGVFSLETEEESRYYTMLDLRLDLVQSTDNFGVPRGLPRCTLFKVVLRGDGSSSTSEAKLIEWMLNPTMKKNGQVGFLSSERSGSSAEIGSRIGQTIKFYDAYCIGYSVNYTTEETSEFRRESYDNSRDAYTITLTLTTLSLEFSEDAILNSVVFERSGESGGASGSSESSSSSASSGSVSSYRAD